MMVTYGPWRDDSIPVWALVGQGHTGLASRNFSSQAFGSSYQAAGDVAWSGGGSVSGPSNAVTYPMAHFSYYTTTGECSFTWVQAWVTVQHQGHATATTGTLPADVYDYSASKFLDPNVTAIEWEPTSTPVDSQTTISLTAPSQSAKTVPGEPITAKLLGGPPDAFMTAHQVASLTTLGSMTADAQGSTDGITFPSGNSGSMTITLIDHWTLRQSAPVTPSPGGSTAANIDLPFYVRWREAYQPRFRLVYDTLTPSPLRQFPRDDNLATSSATRVWSSSQQGSLRRHGYF